MWNFKKETFKSDDTKPTIPCGSSLNAGGLNGIYELTAQVGTDRGITGFVVNSQGVPDRFQIEYDGVIVADTKYIGDDLKFGPPINSQGILGSYNLPVYEFNGATFSPKGEIRNVNNTQIDISDNITEATDGNTFVYFNKTTEYPTEIKLIVIGNIESTAWDIEEFVCPINPLTLPNGTERIFYGFLPLANRGDKFKDNGFGTLFCISKKLFINDVLGRIYNDIRGIPGTLNISYPNGWTSTNKYINDGTTWFELDEYGFVITSGLI